MPAPFVQWTDRIEAAADERARRALLGEIGLWRAQRLTDLQAQREAAYALASIYLKLGEREQALHEASQLLALCRTPPAAPREVMQFAERFARRAEPSRRDASPRAGGEDPWSEALAAAGARRWAQARQLVRGDRRPRTALFRVWTQLAEALELEGDARAAALASLEQELAGRFPAPAPAAPEAKKPSRADTRKAAPVEDAAVAVAPRPARTVDDGPLVELLGAPIPARRDDLVNHLHAHVERHPEQVDAIAGAALRDHVARHGVKAVAPWLIGLTARALASGEAALTRAAFDALGDAWAVTAYREPAFDTLRAVLAQALQDGLKLDSLRRGVLRGGVPGDRKVWTLRLDGEGGQGMVAAVPEVSDAWHDATRDRVVARLVELCPGTVLVAPGEFNAPLRSAATEAGLLAVDALDVAEVVTAVRGRLAPPAVVESRHPKGDRAPAEASKPADRPADTPPATREPSLAAQAEARLAALWGADEVADVPVLADAVGALDRAWRAFVAVRDVLSGLAVEAIDARLPALLHAVHQAAPEDVRLAEGITVAVRTAASVPGGAVEGFLAADDAAAARFGGRGALGLVHVVRAVEAAGWSTERVLVGVTRREERTQPGLPALARGVEGLWRLVISKGGRKGEVWWVSDPNAEALAAMPLLFLEARHRALLAPADVVASLPAAPAGASWLPWSDDAPAQLAEALEAWPEGGAA